MKFSWLIAWVVFLLVAADNARAQTVVNANDRGWYNTGGNHSPTNNNTFTGSFNGTIYRSYFRFTIPVGVTCISSATLELELENYYGDGAAHTTTIYDVTAANTVLLDTVNGSGSGVAIHTDLGTGAVYGSQAGLTSADVGSIISFTLSAAALTDIAAASGSDFAVGSHTTPGGAGTLRALRYSAGNEARVHRLTYTECPAIPDLKASKSVAVYDPSSLGLYAVPGNDVIYTITVTNDGAGSVDANTMFLTDKIPDNTTYYNGDIDDGGPELNSVSFTESGSGLIFTYATDIAFSNAAAVPANFAACTYTPSVGYDEDIEYICINPKGAFASGTPSPSFSISFRTRID